MTYASLPVNVPMYRARFMYAARKVRCRLLSATLLGALIVACILVWTLPSEPARVPRPLRTAGGPNVYGVHNSYARGWSLFGNYPHPTFGEQYDSGMRMFELDVHWMMGRWVVAHVPWLDQSSHASTLHEALCDLASLHRGAADMLYVLVDTKTVVTSCTRAAMEAMVTVIQDCLSGVNATVLFDVSCGDYNNKACALHLQSLRKGAVPILICDMDWDWRGTDCPAGELVIAGKDSCLTQKSTSSDRIMLVECDEVSCGLEVYEACVRYKRPANRTVMVHQSSTVDKWLHVFPAFRL